MQEADSPCAAGTGWKHFASESTVRWGSEASVEVLASGFMPTRDVKDSPMDDQSDVMQQAQAHARYFWPIVLIVLGATARFMMMPARQSLWTWSRALILALFVGYMANLVALEYGLTENMRALAIAAAAFLADDLLRGAARVVNWVSTNPDKVVEAIFGFLDRFRPGKK